MKHPEPELVVLRERIVQLAIDEYQPTDNPWVDGPLAVAVASYRAALAEDAALRREVTELRSAVSTLTAERDQALLERDGAR